MNTPSRPRFIAIALIVLLPLLAGWSSHVPIAVKVGQKTVDAHALPFACITIGTANVTVPLRKLILENLATHKTFLTLVPLPHGRRRAYPYGGDARRRALSMAILRLPPGHYWLKEVDFTPYGPTVGWVQCRLPESKAYSFTVTPGCVNYVGSVIFSADWKSAEHGGSELAGRIEKHFTTRVATENTAWRDVNWACELIPGMRSLPSRASPFGS